MRRISLLLTLLLAAWSVAPKPASAVELALVLLNDVSKSMDTAEFAMVKAGYRAAFSDPEVIAAIGTIAGGVAVAYVEFSGKREIKLVQGWEVLSDAASARAFGDAIAGAPRSSAGNTAMAAGLVGATRLLTEGDFGSARRVIDIASDHPSDGGRSASARDAAVAAGITINALPIVSAGPIGTFDGRMTYSTAEWGAGGIAGFYRHNVIGGDGAFLVEASDFTAFGEAIKRKLLRELIASDDKKVPTGTRSAALVE